VNGINSMSPDQALDDLDTMRQRPHPYEFELYQDL
jgi:hypothetical protein